MQGLVESRKKTLVKMGRKDKLETLKSLDFDFAYKKFPAKYVLTAEGLVESRLCHIRDKRGVGSVASSPPPRRWLLQCLRLGTRRPPKPGV